MKDFLPISRADMEKRGWESVDFAYITGDAYVDHSSFGPAIISRVLESRGYKVGIISQPDWRDADSIDVFGRPRLGFLISGGNMDSMVNHYTVSKKRRSSDAYTAGGAVGKRPDHAVTVYGNLVRRKYKDVPVIIGGIEASLRRLAHYDYWSYIKRAGLRTCTTISFFRHTGSLKQTGLIMPAAFIRSTAIQTRIRAAALSSRILTGSILCRILRQSPCRSLRWTMCTDCLT